MVRFKFRDPTISVPFRSWHTDLDLIAVVALSPNLKGVEFKQFWNFTGKPVDHRATIRLLHVARHLNEV